MEENRKYEEIGRKLSGEDRSVSDNPDFKELENLWNLAGSYAYNETKSTDAAWNDLKNRIAVSQPLRTSWIRQNAWKVAASVAILALAGAGIWMVNKPSAQETELARVEKTGNRELKTIYLEDGSKVVLNSNSQVTIAKGFNNSNRNIELVGEARFEVTHNANLPFMVNAGQTQTRVIGTGFDISAYPGENIDIIVLHGKVRFGTAAEAVQLTKGKACTFNSADKKLLSVIDADTSDLSWQSGIWTFKNAKLRDIALEVKHRFGKDLKYDPTSANKVFTGKFGAEVTAEDVAKTLSQALQVTVTVE